jgi:hypothetical protein
MHPVSHRDRRRAYFDRYKDGRPPCCASSPGIVLYLIVEMSQFCALSREEKDEGHCTEADTFVQDIERQVKDMSA